MTNEEKKILEMSRSLNVYPDDMEEILQSALDCIDLEALDALCYNGLYNEDGKFDGHRYVRLIQEVNGNMVLRMFIATYYRDQNPDGLVLLTDDDDEPILDENGDEQYVESDDETYFPEINYGEVAQFWLTPEGHRITLSASRDQEWRMREVNDCWTIGTPMMPVDTATEETVFDILEDNYRCYDEYDYDRVAIQNTLSPAWRHMMNFVTKHVKGYDTIARTNDQTGECLAHWGYQTLLSMYVNQGIKSAAYRHFHTIKVAHRNHFDASLPETQTRWMQLLDLIDDCNGNLEDPRNYMPADMDATYAYWDERYQRILQKREREEDMRRKERAQRALIENKDFIDAANSRYLRDKQPFLAIRFDTETMDFAVLPNVEAFCEEGIMQGHCVFSNKYYEMPDYIVMTCRDKKTRRRLSTITVNAKTGQIVANLNRGNNVPRNEAEIDQAVMEHMPWFLNARKEQEARITINNDPSLILLQESEARINAQMAGDRAAQRIALNIAAPQLDGVAI